MDDEECVFVAFELVAFGLAALVLLGAAAELWVVDDCANAEPAPSAVASAVARKRDDLPI
jgi:hypothetical protein